MHLNCPTLYSNRALVKNTYNFNIPTLGGEAAALDGPSLRWLKPRAKNSSCDRFCNFVTNDTFFI